MPRPRIPTFKSYVGDQDGTNTKKKEEDSSDNDVISRKSHFYTSVKEMERPERAGPGTPPTKSDADLKPHLLPGEMLISEAHNVLRFMPYSEHKQGISGTLFCTNFKVTFLTANDQHNKVHLRQRNKIIGEQDIALNNVDAVYQASDADVLKLRVSSSRRKKLQPGTGISGSVKNLEIHCKDFRIHTFSFKFSSREEAKLIANAMVHHAFPTRLELLFAFEYKAEPPRLEPKQARRPVIPPTMRWRMLEDWERELQRLQVTGYKAILCNPAFRLSESLPECFVVPRSLNNADITGAVPHFVDYRCPTWCYSHSNGAALIRMAYLHVNTDTTQISVEQLMLDAIQKSHPTDKVPYVYDLSRDLPFGLRDLHTSYERLRELCMPVSLKEVQETDSKWYASLHSTRWMHAVASCLRISHLIVKRMTVNRETVVLKEVEGRDLSALVASLVQMLLDPHYRTLAGFQSLVEKEWVLMGHKFADRLGLLANPDAEVCPVILLFLDCVWQLQLQFPSAFQFSHIYLTALWDSICLGLFDNFIFNSSRERMMAVRRFSIYHTTDTTPNLLSIWDWGLQYGPDDMALFNNPLYLIKTELRSELHNIRFAETAAAKLTGSIQNGADRLQNGLYARRLNAQLDESIRAYDPEQRILHPVIEAPILKFWTHCYLRWLTPVQIVTGGAPVEYLQQCILIEEILCLQHKMSALQTATPFNKANRKNSDLIFSANNTPQTPRNKPNWSSILTSSFPYSPSATTGHVTFFGTPLSAFLEKSLVMDSDEDEMSDGEVASGS